MESSKLIFLVNDAARAVKAIYEPGAPAEIFKTLDGTLKVDDLAIVQSTTRHGFTVVKITEVGIEPDLDSATPMKWLLHKIDVKAFGELLKDEAKAADHVQGVERRKRKEELRKALIGDAADISALAISHAGEVFEAAPPPPPWPGYDPASSI